MSLAEYFADDKEPCGATTTDGEACRRPALAGFDRCPYHIDDGG